MPACDPLARAVKAHLARRKMTQGKLAALAGMPRQSLGAWLNGKRDMSASRVCRVLTALGKIKDVTGVVAKWP